ncbi:monovalent cation/H+ antiporter subunit D [Piscinibacter sakaiensis]|uniref:monovalent cation/H+ antiporter subunit D n=1 Tax=Piscinibacter sakaiensis TaxID=1547922 RepID=UPI00372C82F2
MTLPDHLPVLVVLLPALTAVALLFIGDGGAELHGGHGQRQLQWSRRVSLASVALFALLAALLVARVADGTLLVYRVGEWPAPFGIALVVDRLGAMMVALTAAVALPVLLYASGGWDGHGRHFHPMFQFQLMGLAGAFVTGDLFNLFVFFEVLLIASYVLMLHGQGRERFKAGLHYVVLNLAASALFLVGVALLYAMTGTLNLADLALRVPQLRGSEAALAQAGGLVLLVVFGFKAAMAPLAVWLPATYAATSAPVAALFAIMTKVGVYALLRVHGLALATSVVGVMGALAARTLPRLVAWLTVASVGTVLVGIGLFDTAAWSAALYYLLNSTLVVAGMFLLGEIVAAQRGDAADHLVPGPAVGQPVLLGLAMLLAAASAAGLPPLPGFIGKLMLLEASAAHPWVGAVWAVVLGAGLLTLVGLARAGSILFWHVREDLPACTMSGASLRLQGATGLLLAMTVAVSVFAGPVQQYTAAAAAQLADRAGYGRAVLGPGADSVRPYRFDPPAAAETTR